MYKHCAILLFQYCRELRFSGHFHLLKTLLTSVVQFKRGLSNIFACFLVNTLEIAIVISSKRTIADLTFEMLH